MWQTSSKIIANELHSESIYQSLAGVSTFGEANVGKIVLDDNLQEKINNFEKFGDTGHPSGTTRMSDSKDDGVVNKNLKSHFVDNLYVCSSSVFPTSSYTSPTNSIGALAIRLAEHLIEI